MRFFNQRRVKKHNSNSRNCIRYTKLSTFRKAETALFFSRNENNVITPCAHCKGFHLIPIYHNPDLYGQIPHII